MNNKERPRKGHRWEEAMETLQLNGSVGPALDPGTVKDIGGKAGETEKSVQF